MAAGRWRLAERFPGRAAGLQVNNAVIGAPPAAPFVDAALARALAVDPTRRFALGPSLLDDVAAAEPALVRFVPPSRFYAVPPGQSYRLFEDAFLELPVDAQVVHYVASNHRRVWARGVDLVRFHPAHRATDLRRFLARPDDVSVGFVGRLAREKQVERLAPVAALPSVQVVVVGDG